MPRLTAFVGRKKSGKTTLLTATAAELTRRGRRVMTIKHGHHFDLDRPDTDSWKHRVQGGAARVILAGPGEFAVIGDWPPPLQGMGPAALAERFLGDADFVLVEGFHTEPLPKIEIFRAGLHDAPLFHEPDARVDEWLAVVTDTTDLRAPCRVLPLTEPTALAAQIADLIEQPD